MMQSLVQVRQHPTTIFCPQESLAVTNAGDCDSGMYGGCLPLDIQGGRWGRGGFVRTGSFGETQKEVYSQVCEGVLLLQRDGRWLWPRNLPRGNRLQ